MSKKVVLETAGFDFTNLVLKLFQVKKTYRKEKQILSEMLLTSGVQAGVLVQRCLQSTDLQEKTDLAKQSLVEVERAVYVAQLMEYNNIYKARHIASLVKFGEGLKEALTDIFKQLKDIATPKHIPIENICDYAPIEDEDGFNDVYDGE